MTRRVAPTFSMSHNIDVVNDRLAKEDAERLRRSRPAVVVYYRSLKKRLPGKSEFGAKAKEAGNVI